MLDVDQQPSPNSWIIAIEVDMQLYITVLCFPTESNRNSTNLMPMRQMQCNQHADYEEISSVLWSKNPENTWTVEKKSHIA